MPDTAISWATAHVKLASNCIAMYFFFQAEDGIRDRNVTGVQTCALPISRRDARDSGRDLGRAGRAARRRAPADPRGGEIGRASCRERVMIGGVASAMKIIM